jgi:hypothetical protein
MISHDPVENANRSYGTSSSIETSGLFHHIYDPKHSIAYLRALVMRDGSPETERLGHSCGFGNQHFLNLET